MSGSNALTPAQQHLATVSRGTPLTPATNRAVSAVVNKVRRLMRKTLQTDMEFQDKMRVYLLKTHGKSTFYDNRLHFDKEEHIWMFLELCRQCSGCGHMFMSDGTNGNLLSCAACKVTHYCDQACQKCDWKQGHKSMCRPANGKEGIEVVMHICVRALTLMRFLMEVEDEAGSSKKISESVMSSMFLQKTDSRSQTYVDLVNDECAMGGDRDRVCNHFREKQESNCILYPIWEEATDNLAFVPISLDFLSIGLGASDTLVKFFEATMSTNDAVYFVLVTGMVNGKVAVVGGNSFVVIPSTPQKLCQQGEGAK